jgi:hypothetical protein
MAAAMRPRPEMRPAGSGDVAPDAVRELVRDVLTTSSNFQSLDPTTRRTIAGSIVRIARTATALAQDEAADPARPVLARAQDAGSSFSGVSASKVADTTKQILNAVSFPRFVTELINGVFKALNDSNQQQLHAYVELIQNVAATTEGFADANIGIAGARSWLAERFPESFVVQGDEPDEFDKPSAAMTPDERAEAQAERDASTRLRLVPGGKMPTEAALRTAFGLGPQDSVPSGDPESLVGLARASLARSRQQMLSTMVMMGLQRLVIESGRLNASMRFHIDTRSVADDDRGSTFDARNESEVAVGAKAGPWGVEAKMKNTIGYVSTQKTQTTEEMNTDLDLNSSVELVFRTDYVALDRLAGGPAQERIRVNALNPEAEEKLATADRTARRTAQIAAETTRGTQMSQRLSTDVPTGSIQPAQSLTPITNPPKADGSKAPAEKPADKTAADKAAADKTAADKAAADKSAAAKAPPDKQQKTVNANAKPTPGGKAQKK